MQIGMPFIIPILFWKRLPFQNYARCATLLLISNFIFSQLFMNVSKEETSYSTSHSYIYPTNISRTETYLTAQHHNPKDS